MSRWRRKLNLIILFFIVFFQNLLISEQSILIIKSLTKLPKNFSIFIYPTLVTLIHKNDEARKILMKDFDVEVN